MRKKHFIAAALAALTAADAGAQNALKRAGRNIEYDAQAVATTGTGDHSPLWLTANHQGLSSVENNNGYLRAGIFHRAETDSASHWRIGYGADVAVAYNFTSKAVVQQLYADFDWRFLRLTAGAKEYPMQLKNSFLSSGSQTFGTNARPVPQVRIGIPEYVSITGRSDWAAVKGYIGYGMLTDGRFQRDYCVEGQMYARHVLYHAKAGYLRVGNEEKFPLTFEGGLEMACEFGGTSYNAATWNGTESMPVKNAARMKDFVHAFLGTGGDSTDGTGYANATGNTLGSWLLRLNYKGRGWSVSAYYDHFFEDHSMMFAQYGWRDALYGLEVHLPANRAVDAFVYEYLTSTYQSGAVYHDHTATLPDQISGTDNYYNHNLYAGWQHWGQAIGNPLYMSPLYEDNGSLVFTGNRLRAHHFGFTGSPCEGLRYRVLYTHERNLGTYSAPYDCARTSHSLLCEADYAFRRKGGAQSGWSAGVSLALDRGTLFGDNFGLQVRVAKNGVFLKK